MRIPLFLIVVLFTLAMTAPLANAVPARPGIIETTQPDGTRLLLRLQGDEFFSWNETDDGYVVLRDEKDGFWKYALPAEDQPILRVLPDATVGTVPPEARGLKSDAPAIVSCIARARRDRQEQLAKSMVSSGDVPTRIPVAGITTIRNIVILAAFDDHWDTVNNRVLSDKGRIDTAEYHALFNEVGHTTDSAVGSVRDYYHEVSYGQLTIESILTPWVRLPQNEAYYGANVGGQDSNPRQMTFDAIEAAEAAGFNFAQGDSDGDGWVDCLTIIHSGHGEEWSGDPPTAIWSHQWEMVSVVTKDGVRMLRYHTAPSLRGSTGSTGIIRIGVICHEMGHFFGLPDLYDYSGSTFGIGAWGIMAFGSWNSIDGKSPAHFCAWSKYMLGFLQPEQLHSNTGVELQSASVYPVAHLYRDGMKDGEYFLIENRTKTGFDNTASIFPGLLVYHIDETSHNNDLSTWPHPVVKIEEADGNDSLGFPQIEFSQAGDVWHSSSGFGAGFRDQTGNESTNAMLYQSHVYNRADDPAYYSHTTLDGFSAAGDVMTYNAVTLRPTVFSHVITQPDYTVNWTASANAEKYELREGVSAIHNAFADNAEDQDVMYDTWHLTGSVQRSTVGQRSGSYCYVMQPYDGSRFYSTVQSMTMSIPFTIQADTNISFYYLSALDTGQGYLKLQISNNGGTTWHTLGTYSGYTDPWSLRSYNYAAINASGMNIGDSCVIRFVVNFENVWGWDTFPAYGFALDDIAITGTSIEVYDNWTTLSDTITDTSYSLTDKADGHYAYRVQAYANDAWQGFGGMGVTSVAVAQRTVIFQTDETPGATLSGELSQTVYAGANCSPVTANAPEAYQFDSWTLNGVLFSTDNPLTMTNVHADITLVATFVLKSYTLTYTAGPNGSISGAATQSVFHGADGAAVEAVPDPEYHFVQWSDGSEDNPRTDGNVTADITVTASFARTYHLLSFSKTGEGNIRLNANIVQLPWSDDVLEGMTVILKAEPADGWLFSGWSGDRTGMLNPLDIVMNQPYTVTANFTREPEGEGEDEGEYPNEGEGEGEVENEGEGEGEPADGTGCCNSNTSTKDFRQLLADWLLISLTMMVLAMFTSKRN